MKIFFLSIFKRTKDIFVLFALYSFSLSICIFLCDVHNNHFSKYLKDLSNIEVTRDTKTKSTAGEKEKEKEHPLHLNHQTNQEKKMEIDIQLKIRSFYILY